ncbi:MAG: hypothetical protein E5X33_12115 [Mesorhizobium sp.]|uniref:FxLYD domain-containing protein n=1 Tax=unclassified Mesorhizobium TaxID=325217 RepID=UPI0011FDDDC2|nr:MULTISPECIES: FxLYD domain-containing protein [unclassified Mesorhizobium]MDG4908140.1 FxLYD domain-containing protein [Mesorhizobium sp. WSM4898]TIR21803.1 MAG: hypothetical protein E5X33_12115 [Mesorhizobium sp.]
MLSAIVLIASGLSVTVDSLTIDRRQVAKAIVRVANAGSEAYRSVYVDCAFMDGTGKAVQTGGALISNLAPGETAFGSADVDASGRDIDSAACRIGLTQP